MSKENQERELIKRGRYALTNPDTGKPATFQRVTKFCSATQDESGLIDWVARYVAKGVGDHDDLAFRAASASIDDRGELNRVAQEAKQRAGGNQASDDGTLLHKLTEAVDRGENPRVPAKWKGHIQRYRELVDNGPLEVVTDYIERVVCVPELGVAGTFDRLMRVKRDVTVAFPSGRTAELREGELVVVDVKSSKQLELSALKFATQFSIYSRARHVWNVAEEDWDPLPEVNQDVAFIYWIPSTKTQAEIVAVDINAGWEAALECKRIIEMRRGNKKLIQSVYAAATGEDPGSFSYQIRNAVSKEELSAIWREANDARLWNKQLEALGKNRLRELES